eukprot:TRINITY_DN28443_c1_g1_i6.p2 TRINITY_DN28443_c1_g1~~TRINITY_DN28443_c1_g1_i6.p2  ORF type:complete len:250 (+),score=-22.35 TRINITY_DN28443_c1_g1_i6:567-1316(+)
MFTINIQPIRVQRPRNTQKYRKKLICIFNLNVQHTKNTQSRQKKTSKMFDLNFEPELTPQSVQKILINEPIITEHQKIHIFQYQFSANIEQHNIKKISIIGYLYYNNKHLLPNKKNPIHLCIRHQETVPKNIPGQNYKIMQQYVSPLISKKTIQNIQTYSQQPKIVKQAVRNHHILELDGYETFLYLNPSYKPPSLLSLSSSYVFSSVTLILCYFRVSNYAYNMLIQHQRTYYVASTLAATARYAASSS